MPMAENSTIEWTTHTFNPWRGCTKVSAGCANCYAETMSGRNPKTLGVWGPNGTRVVAAESYWRQPVKWNKYEAGGQCSHCTVGTPTDERRWRRANCPKCKGTGKPERPRVFCASLADVFEDWRGPMVNSAGLLLYDVDGRLMELAPGQFFLQAREPATMDDVRRRLFHLIDATPNLDWLILSKRPENMLNMMPAYLPGGATNRPLDEVRLPIPDTRDYEISNLGTVYTLRGSSRCCFCGSDNPEGNKQKRYCGAKCRQASHYQRSKGVADKFEREATPLSGDQGEDGHTRVTIFRNGVRERVLVHRLVLTLFCRDPQDGEQGRHLDGNPRNNRIDNLAWGTQSANWDDSKSHGTHQRSNKLTAEQVAEIRTLARDGETKSSLAAMFDVSATQVANILSGKHWKPQATAIRPNVFLGTSVEDQATADARIPHLLKVPAAVRFLSVEPLLGPIDFRAVPGLNKLPAVHMQEGRGPAGIDWVIVGCESGHHRRPCKPEWVESIVHQCRTAGVSCFVKQLEIDGVVTGDVSQFPAGLQVRQFPGSEVPTR
jgi:protein gp37